MKSYFQLNVKYNNLKHEIRIGINSDFRANKYNTFEPKHFDKTNILFGWIQ